MYKRIITIVIDSVGVGALEDAHKFNDDNPNTLGNISKAKKDFKIDNLCRLGVHKVVELENVNQDVEVIGSYGKMGELSNGKDTMTGHFEIMGLKVEKPFQTFTETGFPQELIDQLEQESGYKFIGNISASGTEIIKDLGERHMQTKELILYTSADSVLQIAANEDLIGLDELYRVCEIARKLTLKPEWQVGRVIARPFVGDKADNFKRTPNRHDYALKPFDKTVLNYLKDNNYDVISVGKINDIYDGEGITEKYKIKSNEDGMNITIDLMNKDFNGLLFVNLVDFDALYGHRRDVLGYANCLEEFDKQLGELMQKLNDDDLLIVTADHGNDPTHKGTDHTREYVPVLIYNKNLEATNLGTRKTFADIGYTIANNFKTELPNIGKDILEEIARK
jgi:phosphopentomutase